MKYFILVFFTLLIQGCNDSQPTSFHNVTEKKSIDSLSLSDQYFQKGIDFDKKGDIENAKIYYRKAIDNCASNKAVIQFKYYTNLMGVYRSKNEYGDALAVLKEFENKELKPDSIHKSLIYDTEQHLYLNSGQLDLGLKANENYYNLIKNNLDSTKIVNALLFKSILLNQEGKIKEANEILYRINNVDGITNLLKNHITRNIAVQKFYDNEFEEAIVLYKKCLKYHKTHDNNGKIGAIATQYANIAESYMKLNKFEETKIYLDSFKFLPQNKVSNLTRRNVFKYEMRFARKQNIDNLRLEELIDKTTKEQEQFYTERFEKELESLTEEKERSEALLIENQKAELDRLALRNNSILIASILIIGLLTAIFFVFKQRRDNELNALRNQQRLLRAQMNPHFIFNVLSSIQNLVRTDHKAAPKFITKFSRLLRTVLENSMQNYVSITDEIEVLKNYLDLQKLRFPDFFDYQVDIGEDLKNDDFAIPPMLIQPFVENAIEHGFKGIDYMGEIKIELTLDVLKKDRLLCCISDNGVGLSNQNKGNKKSASMALISDFIKKSTRTSLKINNLDKDLKTGTLITFQIPIQ